MKKDLDKGNSTGKWNKINHEETGGDVETKSFWWRNGWMEMVIRVCKKKIGDNQQSRWRQGMEVKSTLQWFRREQKPERLTWPEGVTWQIRDWGSKLLYKARIGALEINGRNREEENQNCSCRTKEKETAEHNIMIVKCSNYVWKRAKLTDSVITITGRKKRNRKLQKGTICTVLGL